MKWTFKNSQIHVTSHRKACIICGKMKYIELEKCYICPCFLLVLEVGWGENCLCQHRPNFLSTIVLQPHSLSLYH